MKNEHKQSIMLLGLDKEFLLKTQLLQLLDDADGFLTTNEIAQKISHFSADTIQQTCRLLKDDLQALHPSSECELIISKRYGIRLTRNNVTLKQLINFYAEQDLSFILLRKILHYRELTSVDFYEEQHISESTLRRKVKSINTNLNKYDIHITFAQKIKLTGSEFAIRSFYFSFLFLLYRQLTSLPLLDEPGIFESRSLKILDYLEIHLTMKEFDVFALVYYAYEHGVHSGVPFQLSNEEEEIFHQFHFPAKPLFLNNWSLIEWQFFLLFLYSSELFNYNFGVVLKDSAIPNALEDSGNWIAAFQKTFQPLNMKQQKFILYSINKYQTLSHFVFMRDEMFSLFRIVNYYSLKKAAPVYYERFKEFWELFTKLSPELNTNLFRLKSFALMTNFAPLVAPLAPITIAIYSEFSGFLSNYLMDHITLYFKANYKITFVDSFLDADLVISTTTIHPDELLGTPLVIVEPTLNANDFFLIQQRIQEIINRN